MVDTGADIDQSSCDGCTACMHRCTSGIPLTREEYDAVARAFRALEPTEQRRIHSQTRLLPWPGAETEASYTACRFQDMETGLCCVYEARPLICRLFGHVEWLPCPTGRIHDRWQNGPDVMRARAALEQHTFEEWDGILSGSRIC